MLTSPSSAFSNSCLIVTDKTATSAAQAFRIILGMFGAPAELVSDNGGEFDAEFTQLCEDNMIDRRWTSTNRHQGNGATVAKGDAGSDCRLQLER